MSMRGFIPRKINPYKGNRFDLNHEPTSWRLLEMKQKVRDLVKKMVKEEMTETTSAGVAGHQEPKEETYGVSDLVHLYETLNDLSITGIGEACEYAASLSEQLLDENNFEMRNAHGFNTMKRNSKNLSKLSEELQKVNDALNTNRMQALALIDEIGMIAHRYHGKK